MATVPTYPQNPLTAQTSKVLCQIVGLVCLVGFAIDMVALAFPPDPLSLQWRVNLLQQLGDRSIVLLFGTALTFYGIVDTRRWVKPYSLACLVIGSMFLLSSILVIRDGLTLQQQTIETISSQANQLQTQIQETRSNGELPENITLEQLQQASQLVSTQAETLKQNTRTTITKAGFSGVGNLAVVGLGLLGLGRYGLKLRRSKAR